MGGGALVCVVVGARQRRREVCCLQSCVGAFVSEGKVENINKRSKIVRIDMEMGRLILKVEKINITEGERNRKKYIYKLE